MLQERHFGQNRLIDSFLSAHAEQSLVISCTWLEISTTNLCTNWEKQHCHPTCITYTMQMSLGWLLWIVLCRFWNYADELNLNQIRFNPWMHSTYETQYWTTGLSLSNTTNITKNDILTVFFADWGMLVLQWVWSTICSILRWVNYVNFASLF